jgi:hypothetical protein
MELPNKAKAHIPTSKITDYLLSESHAVGKSKAKFFKSLGFDATNVNQFEEELLKIAQTSDIQEASKTPHGMKYVVDGTLESPKGVMIRVRTIWIIETGNDQPRFVTAYPLN